MSVRARALDELDALLDAPSSVQDARIAELEAEDPRLAREVRRLVAADRSDAARTDAELGRRVRIAAQDFDRPEELGPYRILRELGRGGMGVVYEAEQLRPRRRVALKTLPALGVTTEARARFEAEVQALAHVLHPGIPQVYELFEVDGRPIVAMELVRGEPLDKALAGADPIRAARVLERVADAIAYVHDRGVVHRDLKPDNILVGADDQPKVLDFGIAALGGPDASAEGTPRYMAPEQRAGRPQDARVDVYAIGVMARELLGESRFRPHDRAALLARATAVDSTARTPSASALADDLRRWRRLQPLRTVPTPLHRRLGLLARRAPLTLGLGVVTVLVGFSGLGLLGWSAASAWDAARLAALEEQAAERAGAERLRAVQQWAAESGPDAPALAQTFARLVDDPALLGTAALSDAWSWWASEQDDVQERASALGQAWVHAQSVEQERTARMALAQEAWRAGRWAALDRLTADVDEGVPAEMVQAAAFWRGDREGVRAALTDEARPLARLLDEARWEEQRWEARAVVGGHWLRAEHGALHVTDALGDETARIELPVGRIRFRKDGDAALVGVADRVAWFVADDHPAELSFSKADLPEPIARGQLADGTPFAVSASPSGVLLGRGDEGWPTEIGLGRERVGAGHFSRPEVLDVDADGSDELILPANGWRDTGLQVWDLDHDPPRLLSHRAQVPYPVRVLSTDPPRLLVAESEAGTTPRPHLRHLARPVRTVRVLRWVDGDWEEESELVRRARLSGLQVADVDGDGRDDVIATAQDLCFILRGLGGGAFSAPMVLPGVFAAIPVQADADPAMELWLNGTNSPGLVLGVAGTGPLSSPPGDPLPRVIPPPPGASPAARRRWERIAELVRVGFVREAVRGLEQLGTSAVPVGPSALRWAIALSEDWPGTQHRLALSLRRHPGAVEEDHTRVDEVLSEVHEANRTERSWSGPEWPLDVVRGEAVRARLDGSLDLVFDARTSVVAELPVTPTEDTVGLVLEVEPDSLDFGAGVRLRLHNDARAVELRLQRVGGGAPAQHRVALTCGQAGDLDQRMLPLHQERLRVSLSWDATRQTVVCRAGGAWLRRSVDLGDPGSVRFDLGPRPSGFDGLTRMSLHLTALHLRGATAVPGQRFDARMSSRRARAERLTRSPDPARAAVGWGRLGEPGRAELQGLPELDLARLLREDPDRWLDVLRARRPDAWAGALRLALAGPDRVGDALVSRILRPDVLIELDPEDPDERHALLVGARRMWTSGDGVGAVRLLERVPDRIDDPAVWDLRARLYAFAGDEASARAAVSRWRDLAGPAFSVDAALREDPVLRRLVGEPD